MLHRFDAFFEIDGKKLMELYDEGNRENAAYFYPESDPETGTEKVRNEFLDFLKNDFMPKPENTYWVWEENGVYLSALRLTELDGRLFYLEALETHADYRRRGYAARLLKEVMNALKKEGPYRICDCVGKRNTESIRTHEKAGFRIVSEQGYDYLAKEADDRHFGFEYLYMGE